MSGRLISQGDLVPALLTLAALRRLTADDPSAASVDTDVLDAHIEQAEALVEGYIASRYAVPLSTVPVVVKNLAARLVRYSLMTMGGGAPEAWLVEDRKEVLQALRDLREGKLDIGLTALGGDPAASPPTRIKSGGNDPTFGRSNLSGV